MVKQEKIVVIGRGSALEDMICNLGRSLGHRMVSVSERGRPRCSEPWVEGIAWIERIDPVNSAVFEDVLDESFAVIVCDHIESVHNNDQNQKQEDVKCEPSSPWWSADIIRQIADRAEKIGATKFVWVRSSENRLATVAMGRACGDLEDDLMNRSFVATIFRPTVIFGQGIALQFEGGEWREEVPLEIVAMAALRASLEPGQRGVMDREAIEVYGDAMMIQ